MNIDNLNKDELLKYKELLSDIKKYKLYRNISISLSTLSTLSFIYYARTQQIKSMVLSAIITIVAMNFISNNSKEIKELNKKLKTKE